VDYDSDYETRADPDRAVVDVDPYSGAEPASTWLMVLTEFQAFFSPKIAGKR